MSWYSTDEEIPGFAYPGSHIIPEAEGLQPLDDAVLTARIDVDEGAAGETTSRYLRLSLFPGPGSDAAEVLLDTVGASMLADQLAQFIDWRFNQGDDLGDTVATATASQLDAMARKALTEYVGIKEVIKQLRELCAEPTPHFENQPVIKDDGTVATQKFYLGCYGQEQHHHPGLGRAWVVDGEQTYCRPYGGGYCTWCQPSIGVDKILPFVKKLEALL